MTLWHEELKQQLEQLPSGTRLQVHDIPSVPETCSSLIANNSDKYTQTRRLILIMAQSSGGTNAIVCGMEAIEYKTVRNDSTKWTVYISKVDTTGYPSAKNITAIMIRTYLSSFGPCRVHVFACAQPQYLFRDSAKYQEKKRKTLTDRALIGWWRSVFSHPDLWKNSQVKGWWSIPGIDDEREAIIATGNRQPVNSTASWQYGYPYDPKAKVNDVIPQFEDDTKARLVKALRESKENSTEDDMIVEEFWSLLGYTEECGAGRLTGFFVLDLHNESKATVPKVKENAVHRKQFTRIWNSMMDYYFDTHKNIEKSTASMISTILKYRPSIESLVINTVGQEVVLVNQAELIPEKKKIVANVLSGGFIKRKMTTNTLGPELIRKRLPENDKNENIPPSLLIKRQKSEPRQE